MTVGPYAGKKVSEAKPIIRDEMVAAGQAIPYSEPEKTVGGACCLFCACVSVCLWCQGEDPVLAPHPPLSPPTHPPTFCHPSIHPSIHPPSGHVPLRRRVRRGADGPVVRD